MGENGKIVIFPDTVRGFGTRKRAPSIGSNNKNKALEGTITRTSTDTVCRSTRNFNSNQNYCKKGCCYLLCWTWQTQQNSTTLQERERERESTTISDCGLLLGAITTMLLAFCNPSIFALVENIIRLTPAGATRRRCIVLLVVVVVLVMLILVGLSSGTISTTT